MIFQMTYRTCSYDYYSLLHIYVNHTLKNDWWQGYFGVCLQTKIWTKSWTTFGTMIPVRNGTKNGTISLFIGSVSSRMQTRNHSVFSILEFAKKILVFSSFFKFAKNKSNFRTLISVRKRTNNGTIKDFNYISETKTESYIAFFTILEFAKK